MTLFLWMIRMAAESASNRNARVLHDRIKNISAHIESRIHFIENELKPKIQGICQSYINLLISTQELLKTQQERNQTTQEIDKWNVMKSFADGKMKELLEEYTTLHATIAVLSTMPYNNSTKDTIGTLLGQLKNNLYVLEPKNGNRSKMDDLTIWRKWFNEVRREITQPLIHKIYNNSNNSVQQSKKRKISKPVHRFHIYPDALVYPTDALGSRGNMTESSEIISKKKKEAYSEIMNEFIPNNGNNINSNNNNETVRFTKKAKRYKKNAVARGTLLNNNGMPSKNKLRLQYAAAILLKDSETRRTIQQQKNAVAHGNAVNHNNAIAKSIEVANKRLLNAGKKAFPKGI